MAKKIKLLGKVVDGVDNNDHSPETTVWMIKLGPYEARITEWRFGPAGYDFPPYTNYSYHLKVGSEYVLHSQSSVMTRREALDIVHEALKKYLREKRSVEDWIELVPKSGSDCSKEKHP